LSIIRPERVEPGIIERPSLDMGKQRVLGKARMGQGSDVGQGLDREIRDFFKIP
jgi:hypothetical protein